MPERTRRGLALGRADLLTNHTNDGWFESQHRHDLHAAQIRLRATELGIPLLRATLTGKSGVFRENGSFQLWGEPLSEGAYAVALQCADPYTGTIRLAHSTPDVGPAGWMRPARMEGPSRKP